MHDILNGFHNGLLTFGTKTIMIALCLMLALHQAAAQSCATSGALEVREYHRIYMYIAKRKSTYI